MAERLRRHTFVREVDVHVKWSRVFLVLVLALVGMTSVIPGNGTAPTANVPKPQEAGLRFECAGRVPLERPPRVAFPHSWWFGPQAAVVRRGELVPVGPVRWDYHASWALVPVSAAYDDGQATLRRSSSESHLVAQWHGSIHMPQPDLVIRQWPRLPLLDKIPSQVTETAPTEASMRQEAASVYCVLQEAHILHPFNRVSYHLAAGQCVLVRTDRHQWVIDGVLSAGTPVAS